MPPSQIEYIPRTDVFGLDSIPEYAPLASTSQQRLRPLIPQHPQTRTSRRSSKASTALSIVPGVGANMARGLRKMGSAMIDGMQTVGGYAWFLNVQRKGVDQKRLDSMSETEFRELCEGLIELTRTHWGFTTRQAAFRLLGKLLRSPKSTVTPFQTFQILAEYGLPNVLQDALNTDGLLAAFPLSVLQSVRNVKYLRGRVHLFDTAAESCLECSSRTSGVSVSKTSVAHTSVTAEIQFIITTLRQLSPDQLQHVPLHVLFLTLHHDIAALARVSSPQKQSSLAEQMFTLVTCLEGLSPFALREDPSIVADVRILVLAACKSLKVGQSERRAFFDIALRHLNPQFPSNVQSTALDVCNHLVWHLVELSPGMVPRLFSSCLDVVRSLPPTNNQWLIRLVQLLHHKNVEPLFIPSTHTTHYQIIYRLAFLAEKEPETATLDTLFGLMQALASKAQLRDLHYDALLHLTERVRNLWMIAKMKERDMLDAAEGKRSVARRSVIPR